MNERSLRRGLRTTWLGALLECHESLSSTNDRAWGLLGELGSSAHGAVVFAEEQTGGRGRHGRSWHSPRGCGLFASVALWPGDLGEGKTAGIACLFLSGSLSVLRALEEVGCPGAHLKWPNDVLINGKKVSGTLVETRIAGTECCGIVIGIGVNIAHREGDFPPDLRSTCTSILLASNQPVAPESLAIILLGELEPLLSEGMSDPASVIAAAATHWIYEIGEEIEVLQAGGVLRGRFAGVDWTGALLLDVDGRREAVHHGDALRARRTGGGVR